MIQYRQDDLLDLPAAQAAAGGVDAAVEVLVRLGGLGSSTIMNLGLVNWSWCLKTLGLPEATITWPSRIWLRR
jgi:hypothetical protein